MSDTGFAPQQNSVKIHLTLMNTRYMVSTVIYDEILIVFVIQHYILKDQNIILQWEKTKKRERMDVTKLLEKYRNYEFGKVTLTEVS